MGQTMNYVKVYIGAKVCTLWVLVGFLLLRVDEGILKGTCTLRLKNSNEGLWFCLVK